MVHNGQKWSNMFHNCGIMSKIVQNCSKLSKIFQNVPVWFKWSKINQIYEKMVKMDQNGLMLSKIIKKYSNGLKWSKMVQYCPIWDYKGADLENWSGWILCMEGLLPIGLARLVFKLEGPRSSIMLKINTLEQLKSF